MLADFNIIFPGCGGENFSNFVSQCFFVKLYKRKYFCHYSYIIHYKQKLQENRDKIKQNYGFVSKRGAKRGEWFNSIYDPPTKFAEL